MASTRSFYGIKFKPGQALGFVLSIACVIGVILVVAQCFPNEWEWAAFLKPEPSNRVTVFVGYGAFVAALWGARIAVINMIRQHTINTLLQSRLSEIFIEKGARVNKSLEKYKKACSKHGAQNLNKSDFFKSDDLKYLLNFYEYIAVGLKNGDLDEDLLKDALRSVVLNLCEEFRDYINARQTVNPRLLCNLTNLEQRWRNEVHKPPVTVEDITIGHVLFLIFAPLALYCILVWLPLRLDKASAKMNGFKLTESEAYELCVNNLKQRSISPSTLKVAKVPAMVFVEGTYIFRWKHGEVMALNDSGASVAVSAACDIHAVTGEVLDFKWHLKKVDFGD